MSSTSSPFMRMLMWPSHASNSSRGLPKGVAISKTISPGALAEAGGRRLAVGVPREAARRRRSSVSLMGVNAGRCRGVVSGSAYRGGVPRERLGTLADMDLKGPPRAVRSVSLRGVVAWRWSANGCGVPRESCRRARDELELFKPPLADMDLESPPRAVGAGSICSKTT